MPIFYTALHLLDALSALGFFRLLQSFTKKISPHRSSKRDEAVCSDGVIISTIDAFENDVNFGHRSKARVCRKSDMLFF
jgi:hypothetical protein